MSRKGGTWGGWWVPPQGKDTATSDIMKLKVLFCRYATLGLNEYMLHGGDNISVHMHSIIMYNSPCIKASLKFIVH